MAIDEKLEAAMTAPGVYERPPVDPTYEEKRTPGPIAQGLSKALMKSAFSKFGQAFTDTGDVRKDAATRDERLGPYIEGGGEAGGVLEGRWHTMEYENFKAQTIDPWVAQKKEMLDDYQRRHALADRGIFEGPDGNPETVDIRTKEGRLDAVRMRGQLEKRFYNLNADMDLEVFNEAGKYEANPMIIGRAEAIKQATANQLMTISNPAQTLDSEDKMSVMRGREAEAEANMVRARATANQAASAKLPTSYGAAIKHPNVGVEGIMQWFTGSKEGLAILNAEAGGNSYLLSEEKIARGEILAQNPDLEANDPRIDEKLAKYQPRIVQAAASKYLKHLDPNAWAAAKEATPWFFGKPKAEEERGIVSSERQDPKVRQRNVDTWKKHAQTHFNEYMADANNDSNIDVAIAELEQWLQGAVYGDTDEPELQAVTAARGEGNRRYVSDVYEQIPEHIRKWWATKGGSAIAQEENVARADIAQRAAGKGGRRGRQAARIAERERKKKRDKGILP